MGTPTKPFDKLKFLVNTINADADLFNRYKVKSIFDMRLASIEQKYQGQNIGFDALKLDEKIAREKGYGLIKTEASGIYSARILEKAGFKCVSEIRYECFLDKNGKVMIPVKSPHVSLKLLVKELK